MNKLFYVMIVFCCFFSLFQKNCFAESAIINEEKYYVEPGSVFVAADGIFLKIGDTLTRVELVSIDSNGIYVSGRHNNSTCLKCGLTFDESKQYPWCPHNYK